ncbi:aminotransferase class I/II-fold pyridoxal phosphate-dependent enzyme [Bacillus sp. SA1-12]|uniref:aminotransferase class I/II-fold pyridoxal phosphate-dependent enzyme n=1 Tax=Bacillus sp. SA1-12 TaxID=1455638 RepID=UPI000A07C00B
MYGLAGLRIGYGISSTEIVHCIHKVREPFNVNALAQIAVEAVLKDRDQVKNHKG